MSRPSIEVLDPGMLTTVQDRGRYGYQRIGVPVSGAMDEFALRAANLLVGNEDLEAGLEMTVVGPQLRFMGDTWIAVTGADLGATLDGEPMPRWQTVRVSDGGVLAFGGMQDGVRAYLAIAGGIDVPIVMGSRSTYDKSGIGGFEGRALEAGDVLSARDGDTPFVERRLPGGFRPPVYGEDHQVRLILGPQRDDFEEDAIATLMSGVYTVSAESDRMGYRLDGQPISHRGGPDIVSDGNPLGAVQVPGDGLPRVLLVDRGTTGGYTKIATVIGVDISALVQALPDHTVTFKAITLEEAHQVLREQEQVLTAVAEGGTLAGAVAPHVSVLVEGAAYEIVGEDGEFVSQPQPVGDGATTETYHARATVDGETFDFDVDVRRL